MFTYPLDVIRTRLAFQVKGEHVYIGMLDAARTMVSMEGGTRALYRGMTPTIIGMAPYAGKLSLWKGWYSCQVIYSDFINLTESQGY